MNYQPYATTPINNNNNKINKNRPRSLNATTSPALFNFDHNAYHDFEYIVPSAPLPAHGPPYFQEQQQQRHYSATPPPLGSHHQQQLGKSLSSEHFNYRYVVVLFDFFVFQEEEEKDSMIFLNTRIRNLTEISYKPKQNHER